MVVVLGCLQRGGRSAWVAPLLRGIASTSSSSSSSLHTKLTCPLSIVLFLFLLRPSCPSHVLFFLARPAVGTSEYADSTSNLAAWNRYTLLGMLPLVGGVAAAQVSLLLQLPSA